MKRERNGRRRRNRATGTPRVLILVQNLPVPFDRRVWLEAQALKSEGYSVTVICPRLQGLKRRQVIDGVEVLATSLYAPGGSATGFVLEYVQSFAAFAATVIRARRRGRFDVLQSCNPPDIFWPIGRALRVVDGTAYVFDHHDLCPELYRSRFNDGPSLPLRGLLALERATFRTADRVISTNESYAEVAATRGDVPRERISVVRTGPDPDRLQRVEPDISLRRGHRFLVAYIGVMGPQDGVDIAVRAADTIIHEFGRSDIGFVFMGAGDSFEELVRLRDSLGLGAHVEFLGRVPDETVAAVLSTADVGLCPDTLNPLNDVSTMNKTMEYMAFSLPVVSFDLRETRVSAQDAATYVEPNRVGAFAEAIVALLDNPERRREMGEFGRKRVERELAWPYQRQSYLRVYEDLTGGARTADRARERVSAAGA